MFAGKKVFQSITFGPKKHRTELFHCKDLKKKKGYLFWVDEWADEKVKFAKVSPVPVPHKDRSYIKKRNT